MLSKEAFDIGRSALETQWPKEAVKLNNPLIKKAWISAAKQLTDDEWYQAVQTAIARCEFLPPVEKLIEFVKPNLEAQALQEWGAIAQIVPLPTAEAREKLLQLNPQSRTALQAIGGLGSVKFADSKELDKLQRQFIMVYSQPMDKSVLCLPQAAVLDDQEILLDLATDWERIEKARRGKAVYHLQKVSERGIRCLENIGCDMPIHELWKLFQKQYPQTPGRSKVSHDDTPLTEDQKVKLTEKLKKVGAMK